MGASRPLFDALSAPLLPNGSTGPFRRKMIAIALRWAGALLRNLDGKERFWLNAGHTGLHNPELLKWSATAKVRPVYLVHDLIQIAHPQFCRPRRRQKAHGPDPHDAANGAAVVANSQHTLDVLQAFDVNAGMAIPRAAVAWPSCGSLQVEADPAILPHGPVDFVILSTIEARKNHALLLSIWEHLIETMGDACPRLVIVGRRGWEADDIFAKLDTRDYKVQVIEAGEPEDQELSKVLGWARALLFPSRRLRHSASGGSGSGGPGDCERPESVPRDCWRHPRIAPFIRSRCLDRRTCRL